MSLAYSVASLETRGKQVAPNPLLRLTLSRPGSCVCSRECVSKFGESGVKETVILSNFAKPYFGAKVHRSGEKRAERERPRLPAACWSPEVSRPRNENMCF